MSMLWIVAAAFAVFCGFVAICYSVPKLIVGYRYYALDLKERAELEDAYRKTIAQILGGAAIAFTFAWTWFKDSSTLEQTRLQTVNQQFTEAIKLLSTGTPEATSAAIYSLEAVVLAHRPYYEPVVRTLRALVKSRKPKKMDAERRLEPIEDQVQAAVHVIGSLPIGDVVLDFQDMYLVGADLGDLKQLNGAEFQGATLYHANFSWSQLKGAKFGGAQMSDWESYGRKEWVEKKPFSSPDWNTWQRWRYIANFDHATLTDANFVNMSVAGVNFEGAKLHGTTFVRTDVSRTVFTHAKGITGKTFVDSCYEKEDGGPPIDLPKAAIEALRPTCK